MGADRMVEKQSLTENRLKLLERGNLYKCGFYYDYHKEPIMGVSPDPDWSLERSIANSLVIQRRCMKHVLEWKGLGLEYIGAREYELLFLQLSPIGSPDNQGEGYIALRYFKSWLNPHMKDYPAILFIPLNNPSAFFSKFKKLESSYAIIASKLYDIGLNDEIGLSIIHRGHTIPLIAVDPKEAKPAVAFLNKLGFYDWNDNPLKLI